MVRHPTQSPHPTVKPQNTISKSTMNCRPYQLIPPENMEWAGLKALEKQNSIESGIASYVGADKVVEKGNETLH